MSNDRFREWAQRSVSRGSSGAPPPPPAQAAPATPALAAPPPGYVWTFQPGMGYVMMPLAALPTAALPTAAPPPPAPPQYQPQPMYAPPQQASVPVSYLQPPPQYQPPAAAPATTYPSAPIQSCALVKGDGKDPYADMMANVPNLVPPSQYDAIAGRPSPETVAAVAATPEFQMAMAMNQTPFSPQSMPINRGAVLGSVPLPEVTTVQPSVAVVPVQPPPMMPVLEGPSSPVSTRPGAN